MVALQVWWMSVPEIAKRVFTYVAGVGSAVVVIGMALDIPGEVAASKIANTRQDGEIAALQAARSENDRNVAYLTCLIEVLAEVPGSSMLRCGNVRIVP